MNYKNLYEKTFSKELFVFWMILSVILIFSLTLAAISSAKLMIFLFTSIFCVTILLMIYFSWKSDEKNFLLEEYKLNKDIKNKKIFGFQNNSESFLKKWDKIYFFKNKEENKYEYVLINKWDNFINIPIKFENSLLEIFTSDLKYVWKFLLESKKINDESYLIKIKEINF